MRSPNHLHVRQPKFHGQSACCTCNAHTPPVDSRAPCPRPHAHSGTRRLFGVCSRLRGGMGPRCMPRTAAASAYVSPGTWLGERGSLSHAHSPSFLVPLLAGTNWCSPDRPSTSFSTTRSPSANYSRSKSLRSIFSIMGESCIHHRDPSVPTLPTSRPPVHSRSPVVLAWCTVTTPFLAQNVRSRGVLRIFFLLPRVSRAVLLEFWFSRAQIPGGGRTVWWLYWMSDTACQPTQLLLYPPP